MHLSLVATPDAMMSPLSGLYEALSALEQLSALDPAAPRTPPLRVEIVAPQSALRSATGMPLAAHRTLEQVERTDVVIVPSMLPAGGEWVTGRYPQLADWLRAMHARGAMLCSACSGALLLAETGLLAGHEATLHWAYASTFSRNFPDVRLRLEQALVVAGERAQFVTSGAAVAWHDLALYLVARFVGPAAAQALARFMLLQWHAEGQAPYATFSAPVGHGDTLVLKLQEWLREHYRVASPVEEMTRLCGLPRRSFERRFAKATGCSPIDYVQRLRVEEAKRRLEGTEMTIEEIGRVVGYEDAAFFRRLFKRLTGLTPRDYRRKFQLPAFARPEPASARPPEHAARRQR